MDEPVGDCGERICNLQELLDLLEGEAQQREVVTLGELLDTVGRRSFAPLLLLVGLAAVTPLSGIPGMPTALGSMVLILALQVLLHRENIWMPDWIQRRKLQSDKVCRGVQLARKPAAVVDRLMRPRLTFFTRHAGYWGIVALSALVAATMPPLEILPFVATSAGLILTLLALALITQDGLVALIAFLLAGSVSVYVAVEFI